MGCSLWLGGGDCVSIRANEVGRIGREGRLLILARKEGGDNKGGVAVGEWLNFYFYVFLTFFN